MSRSFRYDRLFLVLAVLLAFGFLCAQAVNRIEYYRFAAAKSTMPAELKAIPGVHAREVVLPISSVDSNWWILHTEAMLRSGDWRVRETTRDNAPLGREVHWSSGLIWILAGLAWLIHIGSGLSVEASVQQAALLAGPFMLMGFILAFSWAAARRWGGAVGGFVALALATLAPLDAFFCAGEADHHGMVTCFALGSVLAAIAAGAGRVSLVGRGVARGLVPERASARRWMIASGLLGAAGLWVSAATIVPAFAGMALGAVVAAWRGRGLKDDPDTEAAPELWRWWGAAGAAGSAAFYLLEYAPSHFGWRLEVNHPLYALAWLGGGELLARLCRRISGGSFADGARGWAVAGASLLALVALPAAVKLGGVALFAVQDKFLWSLHEGYILEFRSFLKVLRESEWQQILLTVPIWPLLVVPGLWILLRRRLPAGGGAPLALALCAALPLTVLSFFQMRWVGVAQALWLALPLCLIVLWRSFPSRPAALATRGGLAFLVAGLGVFPFFAAREWRSPQGVGVQEAITLVMRDVAWKLRLSAGDKPVNIVSGPTTTTNLAFFGDTNGVGTLYWENLAGLKTVAAIYGAKSEDEALRLCQEHKVTHIVIFSWDAFAQPYARLHHGRPKDASTEDCFVSSLLSTRSIPPWLRPLPYNMLEDLAKAGHWVQIFEVRPDQAQSEAFYHLGVYLAGVGQAQAALQAFIQSWNLDSTKVDTGYRLGLSLVDAGRVDEAREVAARLPAPQRFEVERSLGRRLAAAGRSSDAVAALRRALELAPNDRELIGDLVWLLSTSQDAAARDGAEALRLMERLLAMRVPLSYREADALAAANAEAGRYTDALDIVDKAIAAARSEGATSTVSELEQRRAAYLRGQAFRASPQNSR